MPHTINDKCTACGLCVKLCPVDSIVVADIYKIDPDLCIDCGVCSMICPAKAIFYDAITLFQDND